MDYRTYTEVCEKVGHAPPEVEDLPDWKTRIRCPRCGKSVIEEGLGDHPQALQKEA